jgi:hypothetical protein
MAMELESEEHPLFSDHDDSDEEQRGAYKENMQYAVLSATQALVDKSEQVLRVITNERENAQSEIDGVKQSLKAIQVEQKKILQMLETTCAAEGSRGQQKRKVKKDVSVSKITNEYSCSPYLFTCTYICFSASGTWNV